MTERRPIRVMPPDLALKIAAGEVVERPSSAVKELIDNALDAGASSVKIEVREAGLKTIRVTDDGCGIPRDELPLAFQSHATSKIASLEDLENLSTLGFRGEALPSIAAVSRVEIISRAEGERAGSLLIVESGEIGRIGATSFDRGTQITISNLFANVPARRKFVRSLRAESSHIGQVIAEYALAQPGVRFTLVVDGRTAFSSPGTGKLLDALAAVHGPSVASSVTPVDRPGEEMSVAGLISVPSLNRPTRAGIQLAANGRPIANRSLVFALEEAYSGYLMTGRHPIAAIHITVPPSALDANIHPSKREVRFADERAVHGAVHRAVSDALLELRLRERPAGASADQETVDIPEGQASPAELFQMDVEEARPPLAPDVPALRIVGQTGATFIVAEGPTGLYMIDQHAAHERILFDRFDTALQSGSPPVQPLLEPATVPLDSEMMAALELNGALLRSFGFEIEPFGDNACLVRAIPALGGRAGPAELVQEVLSELRLLPEPAAARERALAAMACRAAVKAGQTLRIEEMRELVHGLETTLRPQTCPHGRPTMIHLSHSRLEREFGRR